MKYLFFTCNLWEGLNQRLETFFKLLSIMTHFSQKSQYCIVLPKLDSLHFSGNILWKDYYDYSKFNINIIEYTEYLDKFSNNVNTILDFGPKDTSLSEICYYLESSNINYDTYIPVYLKPEPQKLRPCFYQKHPFISDELLQNNLFWEKSEMVYVNSMSSLIKLIENSGSKIILNNAENLQIKVYFQNPKFKKMLDTLNFNNTLLQMADSFIQQNLEKKYIAIHVRLGDYKKVYGTKIEHELDKIIAKLPTNVTHLFISTNADKEEKLEIKKKLNQYKVYFYENPELHGGKLAIIDQIISTKAYLFIGKEKSLFSKFISYRRTNNLFY